MDPYGIGRGKVMDYLHEIEVCVAGTFVADKFITILNRTKNPYKGSIARKNNEILKDSA